MNTILPGTCLTILEALDVKIGINTKRKQNPFYGSVCNAYGEYGNWWECTKSTLQQATNITTEAGFATLLYLYMESESADFVDYDWRFTTDPVSFKSFEIWALIHAAQESELKFLEACSKPNNEVSLTAALLQTLDMKTDEVQYVYRKYLAFTGANLNVKKLELQVQNREKHTGGDFALLFEWKNDAGLLMICPIIFQAKRINSLTVDLSQKNSETGSQFEQITKKKCNPVYIFYNCNTQGITHAPRLPVVKRVSDIEMDDDNRTSALDDVLSLSMFFLDVMSSDSYFIANSRREALNEIMFGVDELELSDIVTFSVDESALAQYQDEYRAYRSMGSGKYD